jgi:hypothetical protein
MAGLVNSRSSTASSHVAPGPSFFSRVARGGVGAELDAQTEQRHRPARGNQRASPEEIYKHAGELIHRFQLMGGPIQPYHSRPGT